MLRVIDVVNEFAWHKEPLATLLVGPADKPVTNLVIVENLREADEVSANTLVFLSRPASKEAEGYHLDVALRRLRWASGLVIQSNCERPSITALPLAARMEVPLIQFTTPVELGEMFARTSRLLESGLGALLDRAAAIVEDIEESADHVTDIDQLLGSVGGHRLGLEAGEEDSGLPGVPAVVTERKGPWINRRTADHREDLISELVSWRLSAAVTQRTIEMDRANELSLLSAGTLLDQIISSSDEAETRQLVRRARSHGIPVDGWHEAVRFEFDNLLHLCDDDPIAHYSQNQAFAQLAIQTATRLGGRWSMIIKPSGLILVRTRAHPRSPKDIRQLLNHVETILSDLHQRSPDLDIYCGVGSSHEGTSGMATSIAEAVSAVQSGRLRGSVNEPVLFDAPGIRRLLVEWYSSMTVRESVNEMLEPLNEFDDAQRRDYLDTLRVYLDTNRSLTKSARQLYIHRNTVAYRINRILELLSIDLDDPHQALALHLACHAETALHPSAGV